MTHLIGQAFLFLGLDRGRGTTTVPVRAANGIDEMLRHTPVL